MTRRVPGTHSIPFNQAMELIDEQIGLAFAYKRRQRETTGSAYFDVGTYGHGSVVRVPKVLRPMPGHVSIAQKQVYDDFIRNIWQSPCSDSSSVLPACPNGLGHSLANSSLPPFCVSNSSQLYSDIFLASRVTPGITDIPPLDLIQEETNGSAQFSFLTSHVGSNDDVIYPVVGTKSTTSFLASVASGELDMVDASRLSNDVAAASPPPRSLSIRTIQSDSSSTAGDAVENYKLLQEEATFLFSEWCRIYDLDISDTVCIQFISQLQIRGLLSGDSTTEWFFRFLLERSVARCLTPEQVQASDSLPFPSSPFQELRFESIDAYAMLVVTVLKQTSAGPGSSTVLLAKVLYVTISVIHEDAEQKKTFFNPRPYFRLFVNWFLDLVSPGHVHDDANFQVLSSFANAFHALQPVKVPSFSFVWLELVSHRHFMPKLLTVSHSEGWPLFQRLVVDLFKFMGPYLRNTELGEPIQVLYKGTLRMLLVLLHDFPEFLCSFHFCFCDLIPQRCIQMRNVILSASPHNIRIPDPEAPDLKIDLLPEMSLLPCILSDVDRALKAKEMKGDIDEYLKTRPEGSSFLASLQQKLLLSQSEASLLGTPYNVPLINSLVLYVGMQAIQQLKRKHTVQPAAIRAIHSSTDIIQSDAAMDIFQSLIKNLDEEGCYFFLNSVANQLRFPNSHTQYFSYLLLYLFETSQEIIQEQITRVLLERRIVDRPQPWGLLATLIELIKNPKYNFWNQSFTQRTEATKYLLERVARMPNGPKYLEDGMVVGGVRDSGAK